MYTYIYIFMCTYIYMYIYVCVYIYIYMCTCGGFSPTAGATGMQFPLAMKPCNYKGWWIPWRP